MNESNTTTLHEISEGFALEEATSLINHEVIKKSNEDKRTTVENVGLISGLSTYNDEIEITINFLNHEEKVTKSVFNSNYLKIT